MRFFCAALLIGASCGKTEPKVPGGIVSLLPSITAWVVELGGADRLVACTKYGDPGGRDLPRVDWRGAGAGERILRTGATIALKQKPRTADDPLADVLSRGGMTVIALPSETIDDAREAIVRIGAVLGREREAAAYRRRFDEELARARAGAAGKRRPKVLLVYQRDPGRVANISAAGPGSFLDELVRFAGGENVLADLDDAYVDMRIEAVLRRAPEVVLDVTQGKVEDWAWLETLPAVKAGRVHVVGYDPLLLVPGPKLPDAVRRIVELIHGSP